MSILFNPIEYTEPYRTEFEQIEGHCEAWQTFLPVQEIVV